MSLIGGGGVDSMPVMPGQRKKKKAKKDTRKPNPNSKVFKKLRSNAKKKKG